MAGKNLFRFLKLETLEPEIQRLLWLSLAFSAATLAVFAILVPTFILNPTWQTLVMTINNGIVFAVNLVCYPLFRRNRVLLGARLLLLSTWWNLAVSGLFYQGLGVILSISAILLTLLVVTQAFRGREQVRAIVLGALASYFIFGVDQVPMSSTPWRLSTFSAQLAYPVLGGMMMLAAIFLAFQYRNFSITSKLITAILGATLAAAVLLSAIVFFTSQDRLQTMIGSQLKYSANNQAVIIGEELYRQLVILQSMASDQGYVAAVKAANNSYFGTKAENEQKLKDLDAQWRSAKDDDYLLIKAKMTQPIVTDLRAFRELYPDHVEVFITDKHGGIVATTNRTSDYDQSDELWWQKTYSDGGGFTYIGAPEFDDSTQTYAVNMAVPIRTINREVVGVLRTTFDVRAILVALESAKFGQTGRFDLVIPGDKTILLNPDYHVEADDKVLKILDELGRKDYTQADFDGQSSLLSLAQVRSQEYNVDLTVLNWSLLGYQTTEEAYAPVQSQLKVNLIVVYLLISVMSLVGYGMSLVLSRPILQLTAVAEKVSAGDLTARASVESRDEIGTLAKTFNSMTSRLREMVNTLEQRVADRTRAIETSMEVSRRLSTILDQKQLALAVVEEVQRAFNYYHAHIYLYDETQENLVLVGGTGEAGQLLLSRGHTIARGRGLVGRAAETNQVVLVADTQADPTWLPNPLLPDTKSELAVPIAAGERVSGVLDVQHNVVNGLTQQDVDLLQTIANQVAVAVQNASLFTQTQRLADREALANAIGQKIQTANSVEGVLQVVARELGAALKVQRVLVQVGENPADAYPGKG